MEAFVAGAAVTDFGKSGTLIGLAEQAVAEALADAGIGPKDVQQVYFGNASAGLLQGQEMIRGQAVLRDTGLLGAPVINVENACASSSSAFFLAVNAVAAGAADVAIAVGAEELAVSQKTRSFASLASAADVLRRPEMRAIVYRHGLGELDGEEPPASSPLMEHYAAKGAEYLARTGATAEHLAQVVVKSRQAATLNAHAQLRTPTTVEEVLAARMIADPLRMPMCSPISNGAAALIVMSAAEARRRGRAGLRVRSAAVVSNDPDSPVTPTQSAGVRAFDMAGVSPGDIDLAEVHDAAAPAELIIMEDLQLAPADGAFKMLAAGDTALGGSLPVNVGGGLLSRGHPIGATGCAQLVELADQLRDRAGARQVQGARLGLAQNGGGIFGGGRFGDDEATVTVTVLERV